MNFVSTFRTAFTVFICSLAVANASVIPEPVPEEQTTSGLSKSYVPSCDAALTTCGQQKAFTSNGLGSPSLERPTGYQVRLAQARQALNKEMDRSRVLHTCFCFLCPK